MNNTKNTAEAQFRASGSQETERKQQLREAKTAMQDHYEQLSVAREKVNASMRDFRTCERRYNQSIERLAGIQQIQIQFQEQCQ